ncbi:proteasome regulatory subunit C-terminal-domain-containing protein [Cantharellus anzutake]|uniref:proteasome regulatory subunit C-terminal-domain-containing protein n=1 Tax=Cantharellus anzutake TaxID=1750568 RepID=UPI0019043AE0|nr:proteasome regulatory subunit C-terminal-domain-containing protein [Cantharellus anzutake]KAF8343123.1 proteasome regulatory subunit C-terminal-domain-containing protein [Cantharellus anzutake]
MPEPKPNSSVPTPSKDEKSDPKGDAKPVTPVPLTPVAEIKANVQLIERAVSTLEPRFTHRVLRSLTTLRRKLNTNVLRDALEAVYSKASPGLAVLLAYIPPATKSSEAPMDVDDSPATATTPIKASTVEPNPEVDTYLRLLVILFLIDSKNVKGAVDLAHQTAERIHTFNRRTLDPVASKVYFYLSRAHEIHGDVSVIRPLLLAAQRTASLRQDADCQAVLITLLLSNYLSFQLYSQADKLVSKTTFPTSAGNPQLARYLYYLGRIRAVQLSYSEAHTQLQQAIRRAPNSKIAPGFYQTVHKLFIVVELLMGDIPDRNLFRDPVLRKPLIPYLRIVQAVRTGDLSQFQAALSTHAAQFTQDQTYKLILRLRHNVIKTGVRSLSLAYSLISLRDICVKLHLDSEEDAEYIVGKAVRDGVIEARVDHANGWMISHARRAEGAEGVYATAEPREVYTKRVGFCLELHNESVKAMRYPLNAHRKELASAEAAREREKELVKEIADGELDDEEDGGGMGDF